MASTTKGPGKAEQHDGSGLRVAIVHARWNTTVIEALVAGATEELKSAGVKPDNIVVQTVPGSYELPFAVQKVHAASTIQSSTTGLPSATDLLASIDLGSAGGGAPSGGQGDKGSNAATSSGPFDAIIAIGVLVKGETMHFEYIADAVSHGLMRVQLESGVPVIFGLLTVLDEEQAKARAGLDGKGHNHGKDWGSAAVELGVKRKLWAEGKLG